MDRKRILRLSLIIVIVLSFILIFIENATIHGEATQGDITSNVSVFLSLAIDFSDDLRDGILFGDVITLPVTNLDATGNYNGSSNSTSYYILVSPDGNTPIDLCLDVSSPLMTDSLEEIGVANETYSHSTESNLTLPDEGEEYPFSLTYEKAGSNIPTGGINYMRFWLDIPTGQPPGDYNNSVNFRAIPTGLNC